MFTRKKVTLTSRADSPKSLDVLSKSDNKHATAHPGLRPSTVSSVPCVSTSSETLDQVLGHGGAPQGSLCTILEHGSTDFAATILKGFAAYSIQESREGHPSQVLCVNIPGWLSILPSFSPNSAHKQKRTSEEAAPGGQMRIAWRYQLNNSDSNSSTKPYGNALFCRPLNFKANLVPKAQPSEASYIQGRTLAETIENLEKALEALDPDVLCRVVIPNFLHPAIYNPQSHTPEMFVPFVHKLRGIAHKYEATVMLSMPLQLYPRSTPLTALLELLSDTCIELEPFEDPKVQGFVHVRKVAGLSNLGMMVERVHEYSFKLGKTQFEVAQWGIPVDTSENEDAKDLY